MLIQIGNEEKYFDRYEAHPEELSIYLIKDKEHSPMNDGSLRYELSLSEYGKKFFEGLRNENL